MPSEPTPSPRRIKVKSKTPRGATKLARVIDHQWNEYIGDDSPMENWPSEVLKAISKARSGHTSPSSTRKKRVKEGNRKFIGPRKLSSELAEDNEAKVRAAEGAPVKYIDRGPGRAGRIYEVDEGGILPFETSRREIRQLSRLQKETNPASKRRVNEILRRILEQYLGGGQEFDAQY